MVSAEASVEKAIPVLQRAGYIVTDAPAWGRARRPVLAISSADGSPLLAKLYADGNGRATFQSMRSLWASCFVQDAHPPGLPRALAYIDEIGALVMQRLDGQALSELGPVDEESVIAVMGVLAGVHASGVGHRESQTSEHVVQGLRGKVELLGQIAPALALPFRLLVDALDAAQPPDAELVPSHGDFCPRNILVCSAERGTQGTSGASRQALQLVLIDWDHFRLADPAYDIASLGTSSWGRAVRDGRSPDWSVLEHATAAYRQLSPVAEAGILFYSAARLARMCHILVKRKRAWQVPMLLEEARRLLR